MKVNREEIRRPSYNSSPSLRRPPRDLCLQLDCMLTRDLDDDDPGRVIRGSVMKDQGVDGG